MKSSKVNLFENRDSSAAFTLIELLVVVAIIAILASLLLPAVAKAKQKGQSAVCLSNLKQLQICWHLYAEDYNDVMPPINDWALGAGFIGKEPSWAVGDGVHDLTTSNLTRGVLYPYNSSVGIYRCPGDKSTVDGHPSIPRTRTYQLDGYLNGYVNNIPTPNIPAYHKVKQASLVNPPPTQIFTFIDPHPASGDASGFTLFIDAIGGIGDAWGCLPGEQHNKGGNVSFADGHALTWRWRWSRKATFPAPFRTEIANEADARDWRLIASSTPR